jgi:hypothetical protein
VDGDTGKVRDMKGYLYESAAVKVQMLKTAIEVSVAVRESGENADLMVMMISSSRPACCCAWTISYRLSARVETVVAVAVRVHNRWVRWVVVRWVRCPSSERG